MDFTLFDDRLAVYRWVPQSPRGRALVLHGLGEHVGRHEPLIKVLVEAGLEITAFDLPGHGQSRGRRGDIGGLDKRWDDIDRIRDRWHGPLNDSSLPEFFYGHSLGAHLLMIYALRRSPAIDGLVASSPLVAAAMKPPVWKIALAHSLGRLLPHVTIESGLDPNDISSLPDEVRAYKTDPLLHSRVSARLGLNMLQGSKWLSQHARQWTLPLLLMHGQQDAITSCAASQRFAQEAGSCCEFVSWPNGRHELHHDTMRDEMFRLVLDWFERRFTHPR